MLAILLLMSLVAQGSVCEEARERFEACVPVPGVADRVAQCEQEPETVALYEALSARERV